MRALACAHQGQLHKQYLRLGERPLSATQHGQLCALHVELNQAKRPVGQALSRQQAV
jgi:hypothetical protein